MEHFPCTCLPFLSFFWPSHQSIRTHILSQITILCILPALQQARASAGTSERKTKTKRTKRRQPAAYDDKGAAEERWVLLKLLHKGCGGDKQDAQQLRRRKAAARACWCCPPCDLRRYVLCIVRLARLQIESGFICILPFFMILPSLPPSSNAPGRTCPLQPWPLTSTAAATAAAAAGGRRAPAGAGRRRLGRGGGREGEGETRKGHTSHQSSRL